MCNMEKVLLEAWGEPGPQCCAHSVLCLGASKQAGMLELGCAVRWLLLFYESLRSNKSCLLCDSRCCLHCRKTAGKWRKEAHHPSDTEAQGELPPAVKQGSTWHPCAFRLKPGKNRGSFHVGFPMLELALQQNRITSRFSLKQLSRPMHWHWSWLATAFSFSLSFLFFTFVALAVLKLTEIYMHLPPECWD